MLPRLAIGSHRSTLAGLGLLTALLCAPPAHGRTLWTAGAERPWELDWASYSCAAPERVARVPLAGALGALAYRLEVRDGDDSYGERCELGQANPWRAGFPLFQQGEDRWIGFMVRLPDSYPLNASSWNVFHQLKQIGALGTPALSMEVRDAQFRLMNSDTNGDSQRTVELWRGTATRNRWTRFLMHVVFSPDRKRGSVELYGDLGAGDVRRLLPRRATHTMKRDAAGRAVASHSRIGIYRDLRIAGTASIYFDGYAVATTAPEAQPPAPAVRARTASGRVQLRGVRRRGRALVARGRAGNGSGAVLLELRRRGRWIPVGRGRAKPSGRFRVVSEPLARRRGRVWLRVDAPGLGPSRPVALGRG
jgi:hypothetical protein